MTTLSYGPIAIYFVAITIAYYFVLGIYNVCFHPLRHYPGPFLWRFSPVPKNIALLRGRYAAKAREIHETYSGTVRVAPNELSYIQPQAWKDILGRPLKSEMAKDLRFFGGENFGRDSLVTTRPEDHTRQRRIFTPAFSNTALKAQEPLLAGYADQMVEAMGSLGERQRDHDGGARVNIVDLYNFATFDIMADLTFGEPLLLLKRGDYTPWVRNVFAGLKFVIYGLVFLAIPVLGPLVQAVTAAPLKKKAQEHTDFAGQLVDRRLEGKGHSKPDIWSFVLKHDDNEETRRGGLSIKEMHANAAMFMVAGTETSGTVLSGTTYYLLRNPRVYEILTSEIRSAFVRTEDICVDGLVRLEYLTAVLMEGLRLYNPGGAGMPRIVPRGGANVCGEYLPEGTLVSVNPYSAFTNPDNWARPTEFVPERWIDADAPEWKDDERDVYEPFSYGPRNCLGKNLAWLELRLLLAKILWHYDLELCPGMESWVVQRNYITWEKGPLMVKLRPVPRDRG
ncbi:RadP cytochrome P450 epoxidase [Colletotrichum orchidophilum]|uniref:RadP cytochrome P450 epoxidase n=1 Tax=Colletotrichum orchidophilum TaxID=1209926 RepID=A0A1G4BP86_9PEZI|nr:RadP cytochrome P450 epoxidase [Colletotrichum orchidophilum]OHF03244.1 RadP cytochrome P450 epoxidase [Colletotrichum orchidophilum]